MRPEGGEARGLHDHLAEVFLQDVGLRGQPPETPAPLDDEEFGRIAVDLGLLQEQEVQELHEAKPSGRRLWEHLTKIGRFDVGDVLSVFRCHAEVCSYSSRNVGRYFVVERLGEGSTGRVYRAIHQDLLKHVALKILSVDASAPRSMVERFRREAAIAAGLRHPSIVGVHDVGADGDLHYIAMDLVDGQTLSAWLRESPEREERLRVLEETARAVGHAHEAGVLHRDLKPQNILVRKDGTPVVVDFGLARTSTDASLTRDGAVLGTPQYMAPEQVRGEVSTLTPSADVYALGCVLYESIVGDRPNSISDAGWPVLGSHELKIPEAASQELGPSLEVVCLKCLEPNPRYRYRNGAELADEIARVRGGVPVQAKALTAWSMFGRSLRQRFALVALIVIAAVALGFGLRWGAQLIEENRQLEYAGEVKTAYTLLRAQMQPLLAEAETLRYSTQEDARKAALIERAREMTARIDDETGVAQAYLLWLSWLVRTDGAGEALVELREAHAENPFPALVCAWSHLRDYADSARWPADDEVILHAIPSPSSNPDFVETESMKGFLRQAIGDLSRAQQTEIWQRVPELRWVEDLSHGFAHYAESDFEGAIRHLERVGAYNDLPFEPSLILSFAYSRQGQLEEAFEAIEPLVERRPGHVTAIRALAALHKRRAIHAQREHGGGLEDLAEAKRLMTSISSEPETDMALANLGLFIGMGRARLGEDASDQFRAVIPIFEAVLEEDPREFGALGGLAQALTHLGDATSLSRAAELAERMVELKPSHAAARELGIGVALMTMKARAGRTRIEIPELEDLEQRIIQAEELVGAQPTLLYYRISYFILRGALSPQFGEELQPWLDKAAEGAARLRELAPDFQRAHFLAWWTRSYRDEQHRGAPLELLEEARRLREPFVARDQRSPFDVQIAQRLEELAGPISDRSERLELTVYAYEVLSMQAAAEPERLEWQRRCERLASAARELDATRTGLWGRRRFEHRERMTQLSAASFELGDVLAAGVETYVYGDESVLERCFEHAARLAESSETRASARLWSLWLRRAQGDTSTDEQEIEAPTPEQSMLINDIAWRVARVPGQPETAYRKALVGMRILDEHHPANGAFLNTIGVLHCRLQAWEAAVEALTRSEEINARSAGTSHPVDAAFLAIANHALAREEEARGWLARMETGLERWALAADQESLSIALEARQALEKP